MPRDTRDGVSLCTRGWSAGTLVGRNCLRRTAKDELDEEEEDDADETEPVGVVEGAGVSESLRALSEMRKRERLGAVNTVAIAAAATTAELEMGW